MDSTVEVLPVPARPMPPPAVLSTDPEPWTRRKGETAKAHAAFMAYRDLGPLSRSLSNLGRDLSRSKTWLGEWSRRWEWVARAEAWDDYQRALRDASLDEALQVVAEQRVDAAKKLIARATDDVIDREKALTPLEASRILDTASRLSDLRTRQGSRTSDLERVLVIAAEKRRTVGRSSD